MPDTSITYERIRSIASLALSALLLAAVCSVLLSHRPRAAEADGTLRAVEVSCRMYMGLYGAPTRR